MRSEGERDKFRLSVEVLLKENEVWDSDHMHKTRISAAKSLTEKNPNSDVDEVLIFFEELALLADRGALDKELVWQDFHDTIHTYFIAAEGYINRVRRDSPSIWEHLISLERNLVEIEKQKNHNPHIDKMTPQQISDFLTDERNIEEKISAKQKNK